MFLSLAAYVDENWIMVDAPNTVDVAVGCQMCMGGRAIFFRKDDAGTCKYFLMPSGM